MWGLVMHGPKGQEDKRTTLLDKIFKDRDGRVNLVAFPNVPLGIWIVAEIVAKLLKGTPHKVAIFIAMVSLVIWAVLELFSGVNYFRRVLGLLVLGGTLGSVVQSLLK